MSASASRDDQEPGGGQGQNLGHGTSTSSSDGDDASPTLSFLFGIESANTVPLRKARVVLNGLSFEDQCDLVNMIAKAASKVDFNSEQKQPSAGFQPTLIGWMVPILNAGRPALKPRPLPGYPFIDAVFEEFMKLFNAKYSQGTISNEILRLIVQLVLPPITTIPVVSVSHLITEANPLFIHLISPVSFGANPLDSNTAIQLESVMHSAQTTDKELRNISHGDMPRPNSSMPASVFVVNALGWNVGLSGSNRLLLKSSFENTAVEDDNDVTEKKDDKETVYPKNEATDVVLDGIATAVDDVTITYVNPEDMSGDVPDSATSTSASSASPSAAVQQKGEISSNTGIPHSIFLNKIEPALRLLLRSAVDTVRTSYSSAESVPMSRRSKGANANYPNPSARWGESFNMHPSSHTRRPGSTNNAIFSILILYWGRKNLETALNILNGLPSTSSTDTKPVEKLVARVRKQVQNFCKGTFSIPRTSGLYQLKGQLAFEISQLLAQTRKRFPTPGEVVDIANRVWRTSTQSALPQTLSNEAVAVYANRLGSRNAFDSISGKMKLSFTNPLRLISTEVLAEMRPLLAGSGSDSARDSALPTSLPVAQLREILLRNYLLKHFAADVEPLTEMFMKEAINLYGPHGNGLGQARRGAGESHTAFNGLLNLVKKTFGDLRERMKVKFPIEGDDLQQLHAAALSVLHAKGRESEDITSLDPLHCTYVEHHFNTGPGKKTIDAYCTLG